MNPARRTYSQAKIVSVRPLTEADLEHLRRPSIPAERIKNLRDSHHNIARLIASGLNQNEIAMRCGCSIGTISRFKRDPAGADLIAHYRSLKTTDWLADQDSITRLSNSAIGKIVRQYNDHLDESDASGELIPIRTLVAMGSDLMDRFGYGKKSAQLNINVGLAARLEERIARTKKIPAE